MGREGGHGGGKFKVEEGDEGGEERLLRRGGKEREGRKRKEMGRKSQHFHREASHAVILS